jgi:hypothetical protein
MAIANQMTIRCSQCGQPTNMLVRTVVDAQHDPEGKSLLLNGRLNVAPCPNCGFMNRVVAPLLYHDGDKQLLVAHIPGEVLRGQPEEKIVGELMNELSRILPKEQFKAYMFNPKRSLTVQGLIDQVLAADGITPEMVEAGKKRVELLQKLLEAPSEEALIALIKAHDADVNTAFFQTMTLMAQRMIQDGRQDIAGRMVLVQEYLLQHSSFGQQVAQQQAQQEQIVQSVAAEVQSLGENATRADFIKLVQSYADDDMKLQALVGLVRPAFDYQFFQEFTVSIGQAPAADRPQLESVRDKLVQLTETIDEQMQQTVRQAAQFLQVLVNSPNPEELMAENIELLDEDFMTVLSVNLQEAERRQNAPAVARLKAIYDAAVDLLKSQMSPELRFLNDLLGAESQVVMQQMLAAKTGVFRKSALLEMVNAVEQILQSQGQAAALGRLEQIRTEIAQRFTDD